MTSGSKKFILIFFSVFFGLLVIPIVFKQLVKPDNPRRFSGIQLDQLDYKEISFVNNKQDINISGMLLQPDAEVPVPAAVFIHGSGTSNRNNMWYLTLAHYLQHNGILVILPDKRGSGKSEGNWQNASFTDLATDTEAAVNYLKNQDEINISCIGVIGMSQGGHIAPIVAARNPNIDFVINVVGAAVSMHEQFLYEENNNLKEIGVLPGFSNGLAIITTWYHRNFGSRKDFWKSVGDFNPLPLWDSIVVKTLVLYGEEDTNVPTAESAKRLQALNNPNIQVNIYENAGHILADPEEVGTDVWREDALKDVVNFISCQN